MARNAKLFFDNQVTARPKHAPIIITGQPDSFIRNLSLSNITFAAPGGGTENDRNTVVPEVRGESPTRIPAGKKYPAYGMFARYVDNMKLYNVEFMTEKEDARDAIVLENVMRYKNM